MPQHAYKVNLMFTGENVCTQLYTVPILCVLWVYISFVDLFSQGMFKFDLIFPLDL